MAYRARCLSAHPKGNVGNTHLYADDRNWVRFDFWTERVTLASRGSAAVARAAGGKAAIDVGRDVELSCTWAPPEIRAQAGGKPPAVGTLPLPGFGSPVRAGFTGSDTVRLIDNIRIAGVLDRAWLAEALKTAGTGVTPVTGPSPVQPAPAGTFRAEWKDLRLPGPGPTTTAYITTAMTYDSRRRRCVLMGGYLHNSLWALDLDAGRWECLQETLAKGPGVGKTRPGVCEHHKFIYDEGNDLYRLNSTWVFNPNAGAWTRLAKGPKGISYWESGHAWAYDPDGRRFLQMNQAAHTYFKYPGTERGERLPNSAAPGRYVGGGIAYDRRNRVFVLFGGAKKRKLFNDTWTFSPASGEWKQMRPAESPPGRVPGACRLVWHEGLAAMVLHGGGTPKREFIDDLWVYETAADRWTQLKPPVRPPHPAYPSGNAAAYDRARDVVVLHNSKAKTWTLKIERAAR
jgi:hypothetical protein